MGVVTHEDVREVVAPQRSKLNAWVARALIRCVSPQNASGLSQLTARFREACLISCFSAEDCRLAGSAAGKAHTRCGKRVPYLFIAFVTVTEKF
ncbi:hypothetical protein NDU88_004840 [Pleurodeles waltl]|uniref:Uncharacterized protein n=1 Tax=Pleurodeles waltl TaxID=8319 RepID=A0AAV7L345_PLEWA|nr:hypothetical protein NDU88_004840 [Pleurodeles waltl]